MRRAKIVCTLGPATSSRAALRELVAAGMDVARLNLSHGAYADHEEVYANVRAASDESGRAVAVLVDLQGPKIRLGNFASGPVDLAAGDIFTITTEDVPGDKDLVSTTYSGLPDDARPGDRILIDDGKVAVEVVSVDGPRVQTRVVEGGTVSNHKGLNLPGVAVSVPAMSDKDEADLRWALRLRADWIALSFVRSAADISTVHKIMDEEGVRLPVIAKIEKPQAVENLLEIVRTFDGIMVGPRRPRRRAAARRGAAGAEDRRRARAAAGQAGHRGHPDAGVDDRELPAYPCRSLGLRQRRARRGGRADAVGETSVGKHPIAAVKTMARIIENTKTTGSSGSPRSAPSRAPAAAPSPSRPHRSAASST
jgi:pyruvate kinase